MKARSKEPIPNGLITCPGLPYGFSDVNGKFRIGEVPAGAYRCTARAGGFRAPAKDVEVDAGDVANVHFVLRPSSRGRRP